jgi:hypothetical protein
MKYRPDYPDRFDSIEAAREWARAFFTWYNHDHYHSGLNLMTPASVHYGQAGAVQAQRQQVMVAAFEAFPERFRGGLPIVKAAPTAVYINRPKAEANPS